MNLTTRLGLFCAVLLSAHCGSSHMAGEDSGTPIQVDAGPGVDTGTRPVDAGVPTVDGGGTVEPEPFCGDGMLDPMEQCDDGNMEDGDSCTSNCERVSYCGDNQVDPDTEVCDDGDNASGDGCRSDCQSDETCGNGERDLAAGEICDDGNEEDGDGCSADCLSAELCSNGTIDEGEECDDSGLDRWDGCGPDCVEERSLVIDSLELGGEDTGCDFSGDGQPDNSLARALGGLRDIVNGMFLQSAVTDGDIILLLTMLGLDDPAARDDLSFGVGWAQGIDADGDPTNNLGGSGTFRIDSGSLDMNGLPVAIFQSTLMASTLSGGPEDVTIPTGFLNLEIRQARIHGSTTRAGGELSGIDGGLICGAVPLRTFAFLPNVIDMFIGTEAPPCDDTNDPTTFGDVLVGGTPSGFIFPLRGASPDVDLDGDGLESFEVDASGPPGCQPVITACIDGDGTRIEGRHCALDSDIADGYSTGLPFTAVAAMIVGAE